MYEQKDITDGLIAKTVSELISDPNKLDEMSAHASEQFIKNTPERIWTEIEEVLAR